MYILIFDFVFFDAVDCWVNFSMQVTKKQAGSGVVTGLGSFLETMTPNKDAEGN